MGSSMSDNNGGNNMQKLVLASNDQELIALAKGAVPNTDTQEMQVINKTASELVTVARELDATVMIVDIDATIPSMDDSTIDEADLFFDQ